MIRKVAILLFTVVAAACTASTAERGKPAAGSVAAANQHMAVTLLASFYRCEHGRWPESVAVVRDYAGNAGIVLPVDPDWKFWTAQTTRFAAAESLVLATAADTSRGYDEPVTTTVGVPDCDADGVAVYPAISVGG